jgi:hypothetical protein
LLLLRLRLLLLLLRLLLLLLSLPYQDKGGIVRIHSLLLIRSNQ